MSKKIILEFSSLADLFAFKREAKIITHACPAALKIRVSCELTNIELAKAISYDAIPEDQPDDGLMISDCICNSVFKNAYVRPRIVVDSYT